MPGDSADQEGLLIPQAVGHAKEGLRAQYLFDLFTLDMRAIPE